MQIFKVKVGRIHPSYFQVQKLFQKFKAQDDQFVLNIEADVFAKYDGEFFTSNSKEVLNDLHRVFKNSYGHSLSRDRAHQYAKPYLDKANFVSVGNSFIKKNPLSGWDGSVNTVWMDNKINGFEPISVSYVFFSSKCLHDIKIIKSLDTQNIPAKELLYNLLRAKKLHDERHIEPIINKLINASS